MVANEDLSLWEELSDASGRMYLAHRESGQSRWLWQKWDLDGKVFSENILTKERRWPNDMDLPLKVASGVATQQELALFRSGSKSIPGSLPSSSQLQHPQSHVQHSNGRLNVQPAFQRHHNHPHSNYEHYQHRNGVSNRSYAAVVGNGSFNRQMPASQQTSAVSIGNSINGNSFHGSNTVPGATSKNGEHLMQYLQNSSVVNRLPSAQAPWNHSPFAPPKGPQNIAFIHSSQQKRDDAVNASAVQQSAVDEGWNVNANPNSFRNITEHPYSDGHGGVRGNLNHQGKPSAKRSAASAYHGNQIHSNYGSGRFWHGDKPQLNKRSKAESNRSDWNSFSGGDRTAPKGAALTNTLDSDFRSFRAKPAPVLVEPQRKRSNKYNAKSAAAKALLALAASRTHTDQIATMYERDFALKNKKHNADTVSSDALNEDSIGKPVVGLCERVEKSFLRLTSAPKPEDVRPPRILRKALSNVKTHWKLQDRDYDWVCRQMKSIRQDYKVQHVESADSLEAYETHARLALENGDLGEFNTCVAQAQDLHGKLNWSEHRKDEFAAYRILYNLLVGASQHEQSRLLAKFSHIERSRTATRFSLEVRRSFLANNYHRFFELCANPPDRTMVEFLLNQLIPTMRSKAVSICVVAYAQGKNPVLPLTFLLSELGFKSSIREMEEQVSSSSESTDAISKFDDELNDLGVLTGPLWVRKAIEFLLGINAVIEPFETPSSNIVEKLVLNCKATKMKGVRLLDHQTGLITHAGGK